MTSTLTFLKMEGLGNDFIVTHDASPEQVPAVALQARHLCDRQKGVGGDGIIFVLPSTKGDFEMRIFNSDGSEAEMCGNGIRCVALYVRALGLSKKSTLEFVTRAGTITTQDTGNDNFKVNMRKPIFDSTKIPTTKQRCKVIMHDLQVDCKSFKITAVSMGNPHAVIHVDEITDELVKSWGPKIEKHPFFPCRTNVEFIKVLSNNEIEMRVWERGCGETLCCGTGACASVVAGIINNLHGNSVTVHLPGGDLFIEWDGKETSPVFMTGPARVVFKGSVEV